MDQLLAQENVGAATPTLWVLTDHLGSTRDVATSAGAVVAHYQYDSFGVILDGRENVTRYQYTGREHDSNTDLNYHRARWYDPVSGKWISEDPIGFAAKDANVTRYVGNGVLNAVDSSGLQWLPPKQPTGPHFPPPRFDDFPDLPKVPQPFPPFEPRRPRDGDQPSPPSGGPPLPRRPRDPRIDNDPITGCECKWKVDFDLTFYALVYSFYGHLNFQATGEDEFGNQFVVHHNSSLGILQAGGGILGLGRVNIHSQAGDVVAPCQWPANTGDQFAVAGVAVNVPHPESKVNIPGALLFRVGMLEWWD